MRQRGRQTLVSHELDDQDTGFVADMLAMGRVNDFAGTNGVVQDILEEQKRRRDAESEELKKIVSDLEKSRKVGSDIERGVAKIKSTLVNFMN